MEQEGQDQVYLEEEDDEWREVDQNLPLLMNDDDELRNEYIPAYRRNRRG